MTKSEFCKIMKSNGYKVVTYFKAKTTGGIIANVVKFQSVYEIYVSSSRKHATKQMLSSIMVHEANDISDWFFEVNNEIQNA